MRIIVLGNYGKTHYGTKNIYGIDGIAPTIMTGNHGKGTVIVVRRRYEQKKKVIPTQEH